VERALWAILYDLLPQSRQEYLDWFHGVHIPEKLARPGYTSAAHYRLVTGDPAAREGLGGVESYLALFGGVSTRVFFDPSLSELKARQDDMTRRMMGCRSGAQAFILADEWRDGPAGPDDHSSRAPAAIEFAVFDVQGGVAGQEAAGVWATRELAPRMLAARGIESVRKFACVQGPARHATLVGFADLASRDSAAASLAGSGAPLAPAGAQQAHPRSPAVGVRVWPPLPDAA